VPNCASGIVRQRERHAVVPIVLGGSSRTSLVRSPLQTALANVMALRPQTGSYRDTHRTSRSIG